MSLKEIVEDLFVDEEEELRSLVAKAKKVLRLDSDGEPVILGRHHLAQKDVLWLFHLARYMAFMAEKIERPEVENQEASDWTGIPPMQVAARLKELRDEGFLRSPTSGVHRTILARASEYLDRILEKVES